MFKLYIVVNDLELLAGTQENPRVVPTRHQGLDLLLQWHNQEYELGVPMFKSGI